MSCAHTNFVTVVEITHIEDVDKYVADISISCKECGEPFEFAGVPAGLSYAAPRVSIDFQTLHAPIQPWQGNLARSSTFEAGVPPTLGANDA